MSDNPQETTEITGLPLLRELYARKALAETAIRVLQEQAQGDPRQYDALSTYRKQLFHIQERIATLEKDLQVPPPTVVKLQTATLSGKTDKLVG